MNQDQLLAALSMDLKRVATSLQIKSNANAETFTSEAKKTLKVIKFNFDPRINSILKKLDNVLNNSDQNELAEDALMYSSILQNYYISRLNNK